MRLGTPKTPGPVGLEPAFRLDMLSADELASQGVSLFPVLTPPSVNQGLVLNGTTQYATVPLAWYAAAFEGGTPGEVSIYTEFFPDFNYDEAANRCLCDGAGGNRYIIYRDATAPNYRLYFYAGATTLLGWADAGTYSPLWRVGGKNRIMMRAVSGANEAYLNGTLIMSSAVAWSRLLPSSLIIGAAIGGGSQWFDGTITDFQIYPRKLTAAEAIQLTTVT